MLERERERERERDAIIMPIIFSLFSAPPSLAEAGRTEAMALL
jgi:hypothetical protein